MKPVIIYTTNIIKMTNNQHTKIFRDFALKIINMRHISLLSILIVLTMQIATAQNNFYTGIETGLTNDFYLLYDHGNNLARTSDISTTVGLNIRKDFHKKYFAELAVLRTRYRDNVAMTASSPPFMFGASSDPTLIAILIPVRVGIKLNLAKNRFFLTPIVGYSFCFSYGNPAGKGSYNNNQTGAPHSINYTTDDSAGFAKQFGLIQTGIGLEHHLLKSFVIQFSVNYYHGIKNVLIEQVTYSIDNAPDQSGKYVSKGQMLSVSVGLKYVFSKFWSR